MMTLKEYMSRNDVSVARYARESGLTENTARRRRDTLFIQNKQLYRNVDIFKLADNRVNVEFDKLIEEQVSSRVRSLMNATKRQGVLGAIHVYNLPYFVKGVGAAIDRFSPSTDGKGHTSIEIELAQALIVTAAPTFVTWNTLEGDLRRAIVEYEDRALPHVEGYSRENYASRASWSMEAIEVYLSADQIIEHYSKGRYEQNPELEASIQDLIKHTAKRQAREKILKERKRKASIAQKARRAIQLQKAPAKPHNLLDVRWATSPEVYAQYTKLLGVSEAEANAPELDDFDEPNWVSGDPASDTRETKAPKELAELDDFDGPNWGTEAPPELDMDALYGADTGAEVATTKGDAFPWEREQ